MAKIIKIKAAPKGQGKCLHGLEPQYCGPCSRGLRALRKPGGYRKQWTEEDEREADMRLAIRIRNRIGIRIKSRP